MILVQFYDWEEWWAARLFDDSMIEQAKQWRNKCLERY